MVELQTELLAAVADEHRVDDQSAGEVPDDDANRALVEGDDEEQRRADGEEDVREARRDERDRPLLDAEERRELLVVHPCPEADERGHHELGVVGRAEQDVRDRCGEEEAADQAGGGHGHREPEGRAQDEPPRCRVGRVEIEAEERAVDAEPQDDSDHRRERDERLDLPVVGWGEVARVERQQEDGEDPRDEPPEAVDRRVLAEPLELRAECHQKATRAGVATPMCANSATTVFTVPGTVKTPIA